MMKGAQIFQTTRKKFGLAALARKPRTNRDRRMSTTPKASTSARLVHKLQSPCSQKKKEQKENEELSPVVDKPAP
jgi:hypothetical protein